MAPALDVFATSPVINYSSHIHPIRPDDGRPHSPEGMQFISPKKVVAEIGMHLQPTHPGETGTGLAR